MPERSCPQTLHAMSQIDEFHDKARKLLGSELDEFLLSLTDQQRSEVLNRLSETAALDPNQTIEVEFERRTLVTARSWNKPDQADLVDGLFGPYRVLQQIGRGGMGQVFLAEQQEPVKRRVAVKVINTDTPTDQVLARFEAERQALAMMDHPNIAKVLDAGRADDGRPYFAMELVKGLPITQYCDKHRLPPSERLELFVQTCRAIQHAHQKGIIHRDLKPSNVLVTCNEDKPAAKVIDFGLAKAMNEQTLLTNKTLFTQLGQVIGTLEYMSPEQAEMNSLDIDTRADVYSLGVILYELLTGSTPIGRERLRSEAFDRILAMIREDDTPPPSSRLNDAGDAITVISEQRRTDPRRLRVLLKGDLDWIAMKALDKDRARRYDGASSLGDDVERYLRDELVEARPPSIGYRFKKTYQKNKAAILTVALMFGLLFAGLVGTGAMWQRSRAAELRAYRYLSLYTKAANDLREAKSEAERDAALESFLAVPTAPLEFTPYGGRLGSSAFADTPSMIGD